MHKAERGILGVRKDPKNQMLFSFNVRQGDEWPTSDSSDSDYYPNKKHAEAYEIMHQKRKKKGKSKKKKKKVKSFESETFGNDQSVHRCDGHSDGVPPNSPPIGVTILKLHKTKKDGSNNTVRYKVKKKNVKFETTPNKRVSKKSPQPVNCSSPVRESSMPSGVDWWGQNLPQEVLIQIFSYVVATDGALPFLCRMARLCSLWRRSAYHPSLWRKVDLSYGWIRTRETTLYWLCTNRLFQTREVNLSMWKSLTNSGIEVLADSCPLLESINLSHCSKITSSGVKYLADKCDKLYSIDFTSMSPDAVCCQSLKPLIERRGSQLRHLNFSGNVLKGFNAVLNSISEHCGNLEILELCNVEFSSDLSLNVEKMQERCPRLRVLRLTNSKFRATFASPRVQAEAPGFPNLVELSLAVGAGKASVGVGINDDFLHRLLKSSCDLKLLDLRGCGNITCQGIQILPLTDLEQFFISQSSISKHGGFDTLIQKWTHSLVQLDMAWNVYPHRSLSVALRKLSDNPEQSVLEDLDLSGTPVSFDDVKLLMEGCPHLKRLNLGSCRGLPRGMKREYAGGNLKQLKVDIPIMAQENATMDID